MLTQSALRHPRSSKRIPTDASTHMQTAAGATATTNPVSDSSATVRMDSRPDCGPARTLPVQGHGTCQVHPRQAEEDAFSQSDYSSTLESTRSSSCSATTSRSQRSHLQDVLWPKPATTASFESEVAALMRQAVESIGVDGSSGGPEARTDPFNDRGSCAGSSTGTGFRRHSVTWMDDRTPPSLRSPSRQRQQRRHRPTTEDLQHSDCAITDGGFDGDSVESASAYKSQGSDTPVSLADPHSSPSSLPQQQSQQQQQREREHRIETMLEREAPYQPQRYWQQQQQHSDQLNAGSAHSHERPSAHQQLSDRPSASSDSVTNDVDSTNSVVEAEDNGFPHSNTRRATEQHTRNEWSCPQCTLINTTAHANCEACNYYNPHIPRATDEITLGRPIDSIYELSIPRNSAQSSVSSVSFAHNVVLPNQSPVTYGRNRDDDLTGLSQHSAIHSDDESVSGIVPTELLQACMLSHQNTDIDQGVQRRRYHHRPNRSSYITTSRNTSNRRHSTSNLSHARTSSATGTAGYPSIDEIQHISLDEFFSDTDNAQQASQEHVPSSPSFQQHDRTGHRQFEPRSSYRVVQQHSDDNIVTTVVNSGNSSSTQITNRDGNQGDPMLSLMIHEALSAGELPFGHPDIWSYEEFLRAYNGGAEHGAASEREIRQLPVHTLGDDPSKHLPEDARQCQICLEDFCAGERRKTMPCLHGFHAACLDKWLRSDGCCPICKYRLKGDE